MKRSQYLLASFALASNLCFTEAISAKQTLTNESGLNKPQLKPAKKTIKPPRTMSPRQYAEAQQNFDHFGHAYSKERPAQTLNHAKVPHSKKPHSTRSKSIKPINSLNERSFDHVSPQLANGCSDPSELLSLQGASLINAIKNANLTSCLYGLYDDSLAGSEYFTDAKLLDVVNAINTILTSYNGTTESGASELEKLVSYLRAMHWVESSAGSNRQFSSDYSAALIEAFDRYFNGDHFVTFNGDSSRDYMVRYELLVLVNSSGTNSQPHLKRFSEALIGYANSVDRGDGWGVTYEENGITQVLTHLFNAVTTQTEETRQTLLNEPSIVNNLIAFVAEDATWLVGKQREYQWSDAVSELGRLLQFGGEIADKVRPTIQQILTHYQFEGSGSNGWVNAQSMVVNFDSENCNQYGDACSFNLEAEVLAGRHTCSDTLKVRFQEPISSQNLAAICQNLSEEEDYFHQVFNQPSPVKNDNNTDLEVVIFSSSNEYKNYAGNFFGINTDNGGMYLEGEPSAENNQARFIAFQATWLPEFTVWNLEHEYVHYLDGRFNKWGSFGDQPANQVWWGEGVAEYLSKVDGSENALAVAANKTYRFSDLLQTTYDNGDTERVYYWGYLAVRFMFERHREMLDGRLLPSMRAAKYPVSDQPCRFDWQWRSKQEANDNNWSWLYDDSENASGNWVWTCGQDKVATDPIPAFEPYQDIVADWTDVLDDEFNEWLDCIVAGDDCSAGGSTTLQNGVSISVAGDKNSEQHFKIELPENAYDLRIATKGTEGDLDLYVKENGEASLSHWDYRPYWIGSKEHVEILQPESNIDVLLHGYRDFSNATLTATWKEGTLSNVKQWTQLQSQSKIYQWVYIPETAKAVYFTLNGGSGDAQLYVKQDGWPANNDYDGASSITRGTTQKVKLETTLRPGNYYHILIDTLAGFEDVTLSVNMVE